MSISSEKVANNERTSAAVSSCRPKVLLAAFAVLGGGMLAMPLLPLLTGATGDVTHSYTERLPVENRGAYLVTREGVMQLFTWEIPLDAFPGDAPVLDDGSVQSIVVVQRAPAPGHRYVLYDLGHRRQVPWEEVRFPATHVELTPAHLGPGRYVLLRPEDSSFGGEVRHYFRIRHQEEP